MKHTVFSSIVKEFFENFLKKIFLQINNGEITINSNYSYPSHLRIAESPDHLIAELMGSKEIKASDDIEIYRPIRREQIPSITFFFNAGLNIDDDKKHVFKISKARSVIFENLTIGTKYNMETFSKKINFPISDTKLIGKEDAELPIVIESSCQSIIFQNVNLIRMDSFKVYFRTFSTAFAVKKTINREELKKWLRDQALLFFKTPQPTIFGLRIGFSHSAESFARDLLSLTEQTVKEQIIDRFIQNHMDFFVKALGYKKGLSQRTLKWIEKQYDDDPDSSLPDYFMEREDGYYDILDLKTSALKYENIVRGGKKRPRFNAYVNELIAQLVTYERYFEIQKNREWAKVKYGIKIRNPRLVGIVGNYDNFEREEVDLALRPFLDSIIILSYSDLVDLLRKV